MSLIESLEKLTGVCLAQMYSGIKKFVVDSGLNDSSIG